MPSNPSQSVDIEYTPEFKRALRKLAKKYRHIRSDLQPVIMLLQTGELVGDRVSGAGNTVFKTRVRTSDIQKGKRSGYRLIYDLITKKLRPLHEFHIEFPSFAELHSLFPRQSRLKVGMTESFGL